MLYVGVFFATGECPRISIFGLVVGKYSIHIMHTFFFVTSVLVRGSTKVCYHGRKIASLPGLFLQETPEFNTLISCMT